MGGPLEGLRVVEMASIGPGPFCAMMLADMGAEVVRVERPGLGSVPPTDRDPLLRRRLRVELDAKDDAHRDAIASLTTAADVLVEGYRPGVMERLGLGPDALLAANSGLVYARITGWGQAGPMAPRAGHDINYIALAGVLGSMGADGEPPPIPLNLVADFGGGGMLATVGILAALWARSASGRGQVVDAAMVDGAALQLTLHHGMAATGLIGPRGSNLLDGGAPFYRCYATADGRWVAVGALEPEFFATLVSTLDIDFDPADQHDRGRWPELADMMAEAFAARSRDEWEQVFDGVDACVTPVLDAAEAPHHSHATSRDAYTTHAGGTVPAPAPRFREPVDGTAVDLEAWPLSAATRELVADRIAQ